MRVPDTTPPSDRSRLQFQVDSADVQLAVSRLMQAIQRFLTQLTAEPEWKRELHEPAANELVDQFWRQKERWAALQPPEQLYAPWLGIDGKLEKVGLTVEKLPLLGAGEQTELPARLHALQEEFGLRLSDLAADEDRLLDEERRLRDAGHAPTA